MGELQNIGAKYGTDKSSTHIFNHNSFLDVYERYFNRLKHSDVVLLELGILNGNSLKTWEEYFQKGKIIGLDIDPSKVDLNTERTNIFIGSQNDEDLINKIKNSYPDGFDIVIDDASHINQLTIESFNLIYDSVKPGGYYVIEDTHCTYGDKWFTNFSNIAKSWPGMSYNQPQVNFDNDRSQFNQFLFDKIEFLDKKEGNIFAIHIHSETIVIEKIQ